MFLPTSHAITAVLLKDSMVPLPMCFSVMGATLLDTSRLATTWFSDGRRQLPTPTKITPHLLHAQPSTTRHNNAPHACTARTQTPHAHRPLLAQRCATVRSLAQLVCTAHTHSPHGRPKNTVNCAAPSSLTPTKQNGITFELFA